MHKPFHVCFLVFSIWCIFRPMIYPYAFGIPDRWRIYTERKMATMEQLMNDEKFTPAADLQGMEDRIRNVRYLTDSWKSGGVLALLALIMLFPVASSRSWFYLARVTYLVASAGTVYSAYQGYGDVLATSNTLLFPAMASVSTETSEAVTHFGYVYLDIAIAICATLYAASGFLHNYRDPSDPLGIKDELRRNRQAR